MIIAISVTKDGYRTILRIGIQMDVKMIPMKT